MGLDIQYDEGQTPLDEDEKDGLKILNITTRGELDELEQRNIEDAVRWTLSRRKRFTMAEVLTEKFVRLVHTKMLGDVWDWAGSFRNSNKNIGVDKYQISIELRQLLDDCKYWIEHGTFSLDEIAVRFKHRIVFIHCFANGNGRHSRLMADILIEGVLGGYVFTWGAENLVNTGEYRAAYLRALREADSGKFELLIQFARS
ncbi:mobile mystery protein B [Chitinophaga nivalis]|uniref:Mobile mystery protein B n=1 Tax=Chitinophaga nivalis TaxID=2991709 RepID=A0ABT3ISI6_9BACT|nr:mobile mystery protein B [Chitinophaga nivalis]MCW3463641.1 mobile mystery protein B [Chitinophaga nivalis]MCW3486669.1 mobile mystery protein B [Chitinophaga nivalis]